MIDFNNKAQHREYGNDFLTPRFGRKTCAENRSRLSEDEVVFLLDGKKYTDVSKLKLKKEQLKLEEERA